MRKLRQTGISAAQGAIVLVVAILAAGAIAYTLTRPAGPGGTTLNASATVKLHDTQTVDLGGWADNYMPKLPGVTVDVSGKVTVNKFEASNVTVKLHNKDTGEWVTIIENETINDLTRVNELHKEISSGVYDAVKICVGTITVGIEWTDIWVYHKVDLTRIENIPDAALSFLQEHGIPTTHEDNRLVKPAGSISESIAINQCFTLHLLSEVAVNAGENQVFDIDTNIPIGSDMAPGESQHVAGFGDYTTSYNFSFTPGEMKEEYMCARGVE